MRYDPPIPPDSEDYILPARGLEHYCLAYESEDNASCTRRSGHLGIHVAHDMANRVIASWHQAPDEITLDLVDIPAIATRLSVLRKTVNMWRRRKILPEPITTVSGAPVWHWETILRWAHETGRANVHHIDAR